MAIELWWFLGWQVSLPHEYPVDADEWLIRNYWVYGLSIHHHLHQKQYTQ